MGNTVLKGKCYSGGGCEAEEKCEYDSSCGGGGSDITVCSSGCNYTTIQDAVDNSGVSDKIFILDNRTYEEEIVMDASSSGYLVCQNGSKSFEPNEDFINKNKLMNI